LVTEAQDLDPGNPLAKSLRTLIRDRSESETVTHWLSEAREMQSQGDLRNAIAVLDRALEQYPGRERLIQLRSQFVEKLPQEQRAEMRKSDLERVHDLAEQSQRTDDPKELESIFAKTALYQSRYSRDPDFAGPLMVIGERGKKQAADDALTEAMAVENVSADEDVSSESGGRLRLFRSTAAKALMTAAVVGLILGAVLLSRRQTAPAKTREAPRAVALTLRGSTDQARLLDASNQNVLSRAGALMPGTYTLVDEKPGYRARQEIQIDASAGAAKTVEVNWIPLAATLSIHMAVPGGQWSLGNNPIKPEDLAKVNLPDGKQELTWSDGAHVLKIPFTVEGGQITLEAWVAPRGAAMAASLGASSVKVALANAKARYQVGSEAPQVIEKDEAIPLSGSDSVSLQMLTENGQAEKLGPYDPAKGGELLVVLRPPARGGPARVKQPEAPKPVITEEPAPAPQQQTPKPTPEEEKARVLRDMGLSPKVIEKNKGEKK